MNQKFLLWKTLQNGQVVKSHCYGFSQLCARFQIWAEQFGVTDSESLAAFVCDDRAVSLSYFKTIRECKQLAVNAFYKLRGVAFPETMPDSRAIDVTLAPPDRYGESVGSFSAQLNIENNVAYFWLRINGQPAQKYHLSYGDAGTVGYARINGQYAIGGKLTNVSIDWSKGVKPTDYAILNMVGTIDKGNARLTVWRKETEQ